MYAGLALSWAKLQLQFVRLSSKHAPREFQHQLKELAVLKLIFEAVPGHRLF